MILGCLLTLEDTSESQEAADIGGWEVVGAASNGRGTGG
jgi:hypothetical protein